MSRRSTSERLLLTVVEAAAMLGVGRTKAYELIAGGELLQVVHIGRAAPVPLEAATGIEPVYRALQVLHAGSWRTPA